MQLLVLGIHFVCFSLSMMLLPIVDNSKLGLFLFWVATFFTGYTMRWLTRVDTDHDGHDHGEG